MVISVTIGEIQIFDFRKNFRFVEVFIWAPKG